MNKRIKSLTLVFVMILSLLATAVPALAEPTSTCTYTIEADKTSAHPGDTITFTIYMQQKGNQNTLEGTLVVPEGLTFVENSGKVEDGVSSTLNWTLALEGVAWTPWTSDPTRPGILNGFGAVSYTGTEKLALMKFQCTVDNDATAKDYEVTLIDLVADDENYDTKNPTCIPATVTVTAAPVAVTGVTIDETLSVNIGQTKTPSYTVAPAEATNKTVSFTSDNPAVATVNATTGAVTGVSKGTATITVKTADGNFTDTCTVTVSCAHTNKSTVPAKDSTCTVKGWDEYKECDDCGQLFNTSDVEINEVPSRNLADHTEGTTATCTAKAVCSVCHQPYGNYANHSYTADTKKVEALKTAGNCRDKAVYYYSCSVCGNVESNDAHTFLGDKVASIHVGGTSTVNASEPDHKNQVDGYTGDTKCLGCNEIIGTGTSIPAGAHTPSSTWNSNETHHWKECTTMGCGVVIDGSKAEHSSTGANVATCQHKAVCDVCNVEYGALAAHNPASGWTSDASGHWHACQTANCTEKCDFASHTPDHQGNATEEYAIKCTECGYVIEAQLAHTHSMTPVVAKPATCTNDGNTAYYVCSGCGKWYEDAAGNVEITDRSSVAITATGHNWKAATCTAPKTCNTCGATEGDPLGHTEGTEWKYDSDNHWHTCTVAGCGVVIDSSKTAHTPDHTGHATEEYAIKCTECGYVIEAQLGHTHVFDKEVATDTYKASDATCTAKATYYKSCVCGAKGTTTFEYGELAEHNWTPATCTVPKTCSVCQATEGDPLGHTEGTEWKYDSDNHWHTCTVAGCGVVIETSKAAHTPDRASATETDPVKCSVCGYEITPALGHTHDVDTTKFESDETNHWNTCSGCSEKQNISAHDFEWKIDKDATATEKGSKHEECKVCGYKKAAVEIPATGTPTDPPQTGDNSMMGLWIAVLFVSGFGFVATAVYGKKRKSVK